MERSIRYDVHGREVARNSPAVSSPMRNVARDEPVGADSGQVEAAGEHRRARRRSRSEGGSSRRGRLERDEVLTGQWVANSGRLS
jgi:hypothetical protein